MSEPIDEQAVLVYLDARTLPDEVYEEHDATTLEDKLTAAIEEAGTGDFDGNEFGGGEVVLFMYGPNAEALFRSIEPLLRAHPLCQNARVEIRPGGPDIPPQQLRLPRHGTA